MCRSSGLLVAVDGFDLPVEKKVTVHNVGLSQRPRGQQVLVKLISSLWEEDVGTKFPVSAHAWICPWLHISPQSLRGLTWTCQKLSLQHLGTYGFTRFKLRPVARHLFVQHFPMNVYSSTVKMELRKIFCNAIATSFHHIQGHRPKPWTSNPGRTAAHCIFRGNNTKTRTSRHTHLENILRLDDCLKRKDWKNTLTVQRTPPSIWKAQQV